MKIITEKVNKQGNRVVTVELVDNEKLASFRPNSHYSLGEPMDGEVMSGDMLISAYYVTWCTVEQKWVSR
jgi:hypothetical protein